MGKDLYVGNISFSATEDDIRKLFSLAGKVQSIHLMNDPKTGKFRGTGFVKLGGVDAREAVALLDGTRLVDRVITVTEALPPKDREPKPEGGRRSPTPERKGRSRRK